MDAMHERMRRRLEKKACHWESIAAHGRAQVAELEKRVAPSHDEAVRLAHQIEERRKSYVEQETFAQDARELLAMLDSEDVPLHARHLIAVF